jgi:hypothetical protein
VKKKMKSKAKAPAKKKPRKSRIKKVTAKARHLVDQSLSQLPPSLRQKLEEMLGQWTVGDLRSLGWKALERAKELSKTVRKERKGPGKKK